MKARFVSLTETPTIDTSAYAAGDAVGGRLEFEQAVLPGRGESSLLTSVTVVDKDQERVELDLVLFNQAFTATADQAAFDPTDADLANCLGVVKVVAGDYVNFGDNAIATVRNVNLPIKLASGTTLYGQLVTRGTPTYTAATDLVVRVGLIQE